MKAIQSFMIFLGLYTCIISGCSKSSDPAEEEVVVTTVTDIPYISGDTSTRHALDIYYRQSSSLCKVVFFVPGGAWRQGDKNLYGTMATTLCKYYNYTVVVINYRLSDDSPGAAVHPDHINDVAAAFSWVVGNIDKYKGDRNSLYVFGQSAGAHLVSLLVTDPAYLAPYGYSSANIRGAISMSGTYTLKNMVELPVNPLGLSVTDVMMYRVMVENAFGSIDTAVINPASPSFHLRSGLPPFQIIHTELDMPGFSAENENFYNLVKGFSGNQVQIMKLYQSDYSAATWQTATEMAAAEPAVSEYIGHYAEVVAINEYDRSKPPTTWIVGFINQN